MQANSIITDLEIEEITGYKNPSKQCETLRKAGVFFICRRDGRPRTTWAHFNSPLSQRSVQEQPSHQPNFEALDL